MQKIHSTVNLFPLFHLKTDADGCCEQTLNGVFVVEK